MICRSTTDLLKLSWLGGAQKLGFGAERSGSEGTDEFSGPGTLFSCLGPSDIEVN